MRGSLRKRSTVILNGCSSENLGQGKNLKSLKRNSRAICSYTYNRSRKEGRRKYRKNGRQRFEQVSRMKKKLIAWPWKTVRLLALCM